MRAKHARVRAATTCRRRQGLAGREGGQAGLAGTTLYRSQPECGVKPWDGAPSSVPTVSAAAGPVSIFFGPSSSCPLPSSASRPARAPGRRTRRHPLPQPLPPLQPPTPPTCDDWREWEFFRSVSVDLVQVCLQAGADPNAPVADGQTILHRAASWADGAVVAVLLRSGAEVDARDDDGRNAAPPGCRESEHGRRYDPAGSRRGCACPRPLASRCGACERRCGGVGAER